jgi:hypothetical protein
MTRLAAVTIRRAVLPLLLAGSLAACAPAEPEFDTCEPGVDALGRVVTVCP